VDPERIEPLSPVMAEALIFPWSLLLSSLSITSGENLIITGGMAVGGAVFYTKTISPRSLALTLSNSVLVYRRGT